MDGTARSHVWHHRYDALGNRTETIRPDGQRIGYLHYGSGHLHGITLNRNEIAAFERDKLHRETERTFGKHIRQQTQYDPVGRILQQIHNRSRREPQGQSEAQPELVYYQNEPQLFLLQTAFVIILPAAGIARAVGMT